MSNNDILRSIRYCFDFSDFMMIEIFALVDCVVSRAEVCDWLKREEDESFLPINDKLLATFLNGFIVLHRGKKEGEQPKPEKTLNNNIILRKLKIALNLNDEAVLSILATKEMLISKHELSAFFRNPSQPQYRPCKDQILRNFLQGLQLQYHDIAK